MADKVKEEVKEEEKAEDSNTSEVETTEETEETEVELSDEALKSFESVIEKKLEDVLSKKLEKTEKEEGVVTKSIGEPKIVSLSEGLEREPWQLRLVKQIKSFANYDFPTYRKYQVLHAKQVNEWIKQKAGYQNETTNADGGYLVPPADFVAEVERLEEQYGVAGGNVNIRTTTSNSVTFNQKDSGVTMYRTSEAAAKTGTKITLDQVTVALDKFAGTAITTDELLENSAVDVINKLYQKFII